MKDCEPPAQPALHANAIAYLTMISYAINVPQVNKLIAVVAGLIFLLVAGIIV